MYIPIAFRSDSHAVLTHRRLHFPHRRNVTLILSSITPEKLDTGAIAKLPPPPARASMTLPTLHPLVTVDCLDRPYHGQASFLRTFADATP